MKKTGTFFLMGMYALLLTLFASRVSGQVSVSAHNTSVNTNFNGWNGSMPNGFVRSGNNNYMGTAPTTTGGVYAIPNMGFGYQPSSNATATTTSVTGTYVNNTGGTITELKITYDAFKIVHRDARIPCWNVNVSSGVFGTNLNWCSDQANATKTFTSAVSIANGAIFTITFNSDRGSGSQSSPMIGFNNIKVESIQAACVTPDAPITEPQFFCGGATVNDLFADGMDIKWYDAQDASTPLTLETVLETATYYATQTVDNCESDKVAVQVTVNPAPEAPVAAAQTFCGAPTVAELVAEGTNLNWYDSLVSTTPLTPETALGNQTYYVTQSANGCESPRTPVQVTVNETPVAPVAEAQSFCGTATVGDLVAEGTNLAWYDTIDATIPLTPETELTSNTYYVSQGANDCESQRIPVVITVTEIPAAPIAEAQAFCGEATVADLEPSFMLVEQAPVVEEFTTDFPQGPLPATFDFSSGTWAFLDEIFMIHQSIGNQDLIYMFGDTSQVTTPEFEGITSINISARNSGHSAAVQNLKVFKIVNGEETLVNEIGVQSSGTLSLFDYEIQVDETEKVRLKFVRGTSNSGSNVFPVFISSVTFELPEANGIHWYDVAEGGEALATETPLETGTYYVSLTVNGCESPRTPVEVTINEIPAAPVAEAQAFCGEATVADLEAEGSNLVWFDAIDATTPLTEETELTSGTYYVQQSENDCVSERTAVEVTINEIPAAPEAQDQSFCGTATVADLVAEGTDLSWFDAIDATEALTEETELISGTYYVQQSENDCVSERTAVEVTINEIPAAPEAQDQSFCGEATVADLVAEGTNLAWYESLEAMTPLTPETALENGTYYVSQSVNTCESVRIPIEVAVNEIAAAPTADADQNFTQGQTLENLTVEGENLTWYDAEGNIIDPTTELVDETTYYVTQTIDGCESTQTPITVHLILAVNDLDNSKITFYPNPVKNILYISNTNQIDNVLVFNLSGQLIMEKKTNAKSVELDLSHLSSATYLIKVVSNNQIKTIKVIKK